MNNAQSTNVTPDLNAALLKMQKRAKRFRYLFFISLALTATLGHLVVPWLGLFLLSVYASYFCVINVSTAERTADALSIRLGSGVNSNKLADAEPKHNGQYL